MKSVHLTFAGLLSIILTSVVPWGNAMAATQSTVLECEAQWEKLSKEIGIGRGKTEVLLTKWMSLKSKCRGTGVYEYRLAGIYQLLGHRKEARVTVADALASPGMEAYWPHLRSSQLFYEFEDMLYLGEKDKTKYRKLITQLLEIGKQYPAFIPAFEHASNIQLFIGDRDDAINNAKKVLLRDGSSWSSFRVIVIGFTEKEMFKEAAAIIPLAVKANEDLLADTEFMYASAWTYTALGQYKTAESVLNKLLELDSSVRSDPKFQKVHLFLQREYAKSQSGTR